MGKSSATHAVKYLMAVRVAKTQMYVKDAKTAIKDQILPVMELAKPVPITVSFASRREAANAICARLGSS